MRPSESIRTLTNKLAELFGPRGVARAPKAERRQFARVPVSLAVRMSFESPTDLQRCRTLDLSAGGVFVRTVQQRAVGTPVILQIAVGSREFRLVGRVARVVDPVTASGPPGLGVEFLPRCRADAEELATLASPDT